MQLYDYLPSGNGYKVRLLLAQLGIAFGRVELDIVEGASRTESFLAKNPNGRIPVLETDDGLVLAESNAILFYLADGTAFLPGDRAGRARVLQWMFFEQYSHEPFIATVRHWLQHLEMTPDLEAQIPAKRERGYEALGVMERHLAERRFFVDDQYSIADIALYAYTHVADEGGYALDRFTAVRAWLGRVRSQPGHIPITKA